MNKVIVKPDELPFPTDTSSRQEAIITLRQIRQQMLVHGWNPYLRHCMDDWLDHLNRLDKAKGKP